MSKAKTIFLAIFAIAISTVIIVLDSTNISYYGPTDAYRVYLKGKSIGLISSKKDLEEKIDKEATAIKEKYNTDKVYPPTDLEIKKEITYSNKIESVDDIYNKIKNEEDFTIEGYRLTIYNKKQQENKGDGHKPDEDKAEIEKKYVYLLDKSILNEAIDTTVLSFVDENEYKEYLSNNDRKIEDTGSLIENVYIKEEMTIKRMLIPVNEEIFSDSKSLAEYLLYGTSNNKTIYTVKEGDTIESIADKHKLNTREFLTANRDLSSDNALLYNGEQVVVSLIDPVVTVVEETHNVERQTIKYRTEIEEDKNYYVGYSKVIREGTNGESLVTKKVQKENGQITNVLPVSSEVIKPAVNRVVKRGSSSGLIIGDVGIWAWPTIQGYTLTDPFGWRWGKLHKGQDIAGLGCNSPIFAANDGTVISAHYNSGGYGNVVRIDHHNGYVSLYAHLSRIDVEKGQVVRMGQRIGLMGDTGFSFGCHLHFEVAHNGVPFNPMQIYR